MPPIKVSPRFFSPPVSTGTDPGTVGASKVGGGGRAAPVKVDAWLRGDTGTATVG